MAERARLFSPRAEAVAFAVLAVAHLAAGLVLLPAWSFTKYPDAAALLRSGALGAEEGADFSPLYLLLNAVLSPQVLRVLQSLLGASAVVATGLFARARFGGLAGLAAALFCAAAPVLLVYEATLEPDLIVAAAGAWLLFHLGGGASAPTPRALVAAGLWLGVQAASRPTGFAFLPLAAAFLFFTDAKIHPGLSARARRLALFVAPALLVGLGPPLSLRAAAGGQVGATMSAGEVLFIGNRPEGTGAGAQPQLLLKSLEAQTVSAERPDHAHALWRRFARLATEGELSAGAAERYWAGRVFAFASRHPAGLLSLWLRKAEHFFFGPDTHDVVSARRAQQRLHSLAPFPPTEWLLSLGLFGLAALLLVERKGALPALYVLQLAALGVAFYVVGRYRLSALYPLCALAGGLLGLAQRSRKGALAAAASVALVALSLQLPAVRDTRRVLARVADSGTGLRALAERANDGRASDARAPFVSAVSAFPFLPWLSDLRGVPFEDPSVLAEAAARSVERYGVDEPVDALLAAQLLHDAGRCDAALPLLAGLRDADVRWAIFDRLVDAPLLEAACLRTQGDLPGARAAVSRSLDVRPGTREGLAAAIAATAALADPASVEGLSEELFALHDPLSAHHALAVAYADWNLPAPALAHAEEALKVLPDSALLHAERARALAKAGRHEDAARAFMRAVGLFPSHAFAVSPFDETARALLEERPEDPNVLLFAAEHAYRRGRPEEALARFDAALARLPASTASALAAKRAVIARAAGRSSD